MVFIRMNEDPPLNTRANIQSADAHKQMSTRAQRNKLYSRAQEQKLNCTTNQSIRFIRLRQRFVYLLVCLTVGLHSP